MDFQFNDMQQMLIDSAARLMKDNSGVEHWRGRRQLADGCDPAMWKQFAELGWLALAVPEDAGGLGGSMEDVALLMVELGRSLSTDPLVSTAILAAHVIDQLAAPEARESLLGAISGGEQRFALAHEEAAGRYDFDGPRATMARRTADGFVLTGQKLMVIDAPSSHQLLITASIEGEPGYGIFLVAADTPGLMQKPYALIDGSRAADLDLADVSVTARQLLASGQAAVEVLGRAIDRATVALMAQAVGAMESTVTLAADYARERKQFGQPIGKFQAIQHMATDMFVSAYEARSALYQLLAHADGPAIERDRAVAIARYKIAAAGRTVGNNGIQIHGGYGVTDEYAVSHYYRRLFSIERQYGDEAHYLERLSGMGSAEVYESFQRASVVPLAGQTVSLRTGRGGCEQLQDVKPGFICEIRGFQAASAGEGDAAALRSQIDRAGVLVLKDQQGLDDDALIAFAGLFGPLHRSITVQRSDMDRRLVRDELSDISNLERDGSILSADDNRRIQQRANLVWHTDNSFRYPAGLYTLLAAKVVPDRGGETEFADTRSAYDALPLGMKQKIETLQVEHSLARTRRLVGTGQMFDVEEEKRFPSRLQPLVRRNPRTGRAALYLGSHAARIDGWPEDEGRALLDELLEFATRPEFVHRHVWSHGDLVMWDNTATLHRAIPFDDTVLRRDLRRVSTMLFED